MAGRPDQTYVQYWKLAKNGYRIPYPDGTTTRVQLLSVTALILAVQTGSLSFPLQHITRTHVDEFIKSLPTCHVLCKVLATHAEIKFDILPPVNLLIILLISPVINILQLQNITEYCSVCLFILIISQVAVEFWKQLTPLWASHCIY